MKFEMVTKSRSFTDPNFGCKPEEREITDYISKGVINLEVNKNEKGKLEEKINLERFFEKLSLSLINEFNEEEPATKNIFSIIEQEFNRKLSPLECEVVKEWQDSNYSDELIKEAIKEASINGVSNLRYIDKILFEWDKQGIKVPSDIKKNKEVDKSSDW